MLETKLFEFEPGKEILETYDLVHTFWDNFRESYTGTRPKVDLFRKAEKTSSGDIGFDFHVTYVLKDEAEKIHELDDIKFVTDAMTIAKQHRMIDGEVYEIVEDVSVHGKYVVAVDKIPAYKITIGPFTRWIYMPVSFESYDKKAFFKRNIILDQREHIKQIGLELSVEDKKKDKLFVGMYKQVLKEYRKLDMKEVEQKSKH